ncbi:FAD binding domain-containing protein [Coccidioides immitis H538.4]|uniref:FAD binding domain-containing protein n=1 Tax=Coccidioides immitis H538.4 TaxID=396776 RepID=A0A0J8RSR5_COCIT|nr:FAD binding domain-containing protein [Coccidioides immitis H538.4]
MAAAAVMCNRHHLHPHLDNFTVMTYYLSSNITKEPFSQGGIVASSSLMPGASPMSAYSSQRKVIDTDIAVPELELDSLLHCSLSGLMIIRVFVESWCSGRLLSEAKPLIEVARLRALLEAQSIVHVRRDMTLDTFLSVIKTRLSERAEVLTGAFDSTFWEKRWSDDGFQVPGAIVRPGCEDDVIQIVKYAKITSTPFAVATGCHSPWSSIKKHGFIIDMSSYSTIDVDPTARTVKVRGGVLHKEFQAALARQGQCTVVGDAQNIGVIPYFIGGGISIFSGRFGFGSDNILSGRIVTADGSLLHVSDNLNSDLFWALRGAGQFFGIVTELTIRTYPLSLIGSEIGTHYFSRFFFPISKVREVGAVMENIIRNRSQPTAGHLMIMAQPPKFEQIIVVIIGWRASGSSAPVTDTAFGNAGRLLWLNLLTWYGDVSSRAMVANFVAEATRIGRKGSAEDKYISYTNSNREDPLEWRYKGVERVRRLRELKQRWDPEILADWLKKAVFRSR